MRGAFEGGAAGGLYDTQRLGVKLLVGSGKQRRAQDNLDISMYDSANDDL